MMTNFFNRTRVVLAHLIIVLLAAFLPSAARANLDDHGGPVMRDTIHAFFIYWTPSGVVLDNSVADGTGNFVSLHQRFFLDVAATGFMNVVVQYPGHCSGGRCVLSNGGGSVAFGGSWVDTQAYPTHGSP